jgi:hypothetical protein
MDPCRLQSLVFAIRNGGGLRCFLQETRDGALDTGRGLHGVDVATEQERDEARRQSRFLRAGAGEVRFRTMD